MFCHWFFPLIWNKMKHCLKMCLCACIDSMHKCMDERECLLCFYTLIIKLQLKEAKLCLYSFDDHVVIQILSPPAQNHSPRSPSLTDWANRFQCFWVCLCNFLWVSCGPVFCSNKMLLFVLTLVKKKKKKNSTNPPKPETGNHINIDY